MERCGPAGGLAPPTQCPSGWVLRAALRAAIDATVLLSKCNVMVHTSSSLSTAASLMNPNLILVRA